MRGGHRLDFLPAFGERHVEHRLTEADSLHQELKSQRGLAGAGHALDKVQAPRCKTPGQHVIQAAHSAAGKRLRLVVFIRGRWHGDGSTGNRMTWVKPSDYHVKIKSLISA